jgi:hypothetical protein
MAHKKVLWYCQQVLAFAGNGVLMVALIVCVAIVGSEEHNIVSLIVVQVENESFLCIFTVIVIER